MNDSTGDIAADVISSKQVLLRGPLQYVPEVDFVRCVGNRRKLNPIVVCEIRSHKLLENDVPQARIPSRNAEPNRVILQHGKIELAFVLHDQRRVVSNEIGRERNPKHSQYRDESCHGEPISPKLPGYDSRVSFRSQFLFHARSSDRLACTRNPKSEYRPASAKHSG